MKQKNSINFWGWYYFDVHTLDGYDVVFTLHNRPFMSLFDVAIFDFFIYYENRCILHHFFTLPQAQERLQKEPFLLRYDNRNYIKEKDDGMEVVAGDSRLTLQLHLTNCLPPAKKIHLRLPVNDDRYFAWQLSAPQSASAGRISWDKRKVSLQGRGYHDRNYGTIHLKKVLNGWRWAKFYLPQEMIILGEIDFRNGDKRSVLVRCAEQGCRWTQEVETKRVNEVLKISGSLGSIELRHQSGQRIDRTYFLIPTWPPAVRQIEKVRELLAFFTIHFKVLRPLKKLFTNGRYERYKNVYLTQDAREASAFQERIFF